MTLAVAILLLGSSSLLSPGLMTQSTSPSSSQSSSAVTQEQPPQNPAPPAASKPGTAQPSDTSAPVTQTKKPAPKRIRRKKRASLANCDAGPASSTNSGVTSPAGTGAQSPAAGASEAQKNCPPPKIVVQKGGITEQSIQLAGGSANDAIEKRDAANRMLAATEENLKKLSGRELTTEQQDSVSQIRQFVNQSKSALTMGDLERAQTLAWKAKLLSDDLVNPGK